MKKCLLWYLLLFVLVPCIFGLAVALFNRSGENENKNENEVVLVNLDDEDKANLDDDDEDKDKKKAVIVKLNEANFDAETKTGVVLVDFYADWCGPCRQLAPILETLTDVKVGKVDVDVEQKLALEYNVSSIPLLVFLKDGEEQSRLVGVHSKEKIQKVIDDLKD